MHELEQKILNFVKINGPVLPVQISKSIGKDIIYAGAILSSLIASKQILITNAKIGGSPIYYVKGQEPKLQVLGPHLKQKEREAFELLRGKGILRDSEVGPVNRVALREIVDFAFSITGKINDKEEIFWRWYLISDEEAKKRISALFEPAKEIKEVINKSFKEVEPIVEKKFIEKSLIKKEEIAPLKVEKEIKKDIKDEFLDIVEAYIKKSGIEMMTRELVKKNREVNMIVKLPTSIGMLNFFLKAKNKKSISNLDLSLAHNEGQQRNLPTLFLSNGNVAKKADQFIKKNLKNQLVLKQIN